LSSPDTADTDNDGASDLLEIVSGTLPYDSSSVPTPEQFQTPAARVLGYLENQNFHIFVAVYVPSGNIAAIQNPGSVLFAPHVEGFGPVLLDLNPLVLAGDIQSNPAPGGGIVVSSDSWFPQEWVNSFVWDQDHNAQLCIAFAGSVDGVSVKDVALFSTTASFDTTLLSFSYLQVKQGLGGGSGAFRPLQPASVPPDWNQNTACFVTTILVGVEFGSILVLQTVAAECKPLVPALCSPASCGEQVGRILKVLDPCSLGDCR
jgi:hypothetical protein